MWLCIVVPGLIHAEDKEAGCFLITILLEHEARISRPKASTLRLNVNVDSDTGYNHKTFPQLQA